MSWGLQIFNENNVSLIDDMRTFRVVARGTVTTASAYTGSGGQYITWNKAAWVSPLLFVAPPLGVYVSKLNVLSDGSAVKIQKWGTSVSVDYMVLVPVNEPSSDAYGLRVYDASGLETALIDSGYDVGVVDGTTDLTTLSKQLNTSGYTRDIATVSPPSGNKRYVYIGDESGKISGTYRDDYDGYTGWEEWHEACVVNSSTVRYRNITIFDQNSTELGERNPHIGFSAYSK